jgi:four helix bundle protein
MTYERFEQLPVWQAAIELVERLFRLTDNRGFRLKGDLANQLERAALSVSNNVAEGFERGTTNELIAFLYYARGSAGEVRSMLRLCQRLPYFEAANLKSEISNLVSLGESVSRQLRGWADSLQNSDITGQRHLNEKTRGQYEHKQQTDAFWRQLEELRARDRKLAAETDERAAQRRVPRPCRP